MDRETLLRSKADSIRNEVISVAVANGAGHIAPSLSCVDILVALYYDVMRYDEKDHLSPQRDRLIFSKDHGCYGLYAILTDKGLIPRAVWQSFYKQNGPLWGCAERNLAYGLEASCGSLGHGLPLAVGVAFGGKEQNCDFHTFCVVGDGELQEGTTWEAVQFAVKHELANLTIIVDANRLQAMDFIVKVMDKKNSDLINRFEGFGLKTHSCHGHDPVRLANLARKLQYSTEPAPQVIVAQTIKGYGLKCMENAPKFHFRIPSEEELQVEKEHV